MDRQLNPALAALAFGLLTAPPAAASGDPAQGQAVFATECAACHSTTRNGPAVLGPTLFGISGRPAGTVRGYTYSAAMRAAGFNWTDERLQSFLPAPGSLVPGTKMNYGGLKNSFQLDDLVSYLNTLK